MEFVRGHSLNSLDPSGKIGISCGCERYGNTNSGGANGAPSLDSYTASVDCLGLEETCCGEACGDGGGWFTGHWTVDGAGPSDPGDADYCAGDWASASNYLDCVGCCVENDEFWKSVEATCGVGGLREKKRNPKPGQKPTTTIHLKTRRCLPKGCRPTMQSVRVCGKVSGVLFVMEGCYDAGISAGCAAFCAAR